MSYSGEPYAHSKSKIKFELDFSNYTTKFDLKCAADADTSKLAEEADLASLKSDINKLDIDRLETAHVDLSELSNVVKKDVVKKDSLQWIGEKCLCYSDY